MAPTGDVTNELVSKFIESISSKYDLEEDDLIAEWEKSLKLSAKKGAGKGKKAAANGSVKSEPAKKAAGKGKAEKAEKNSDASDEEEEELKPIPDEILESSNVATLKEFCRKRKLYVTGSKAVLIARLRGEDEKAVTPKKGAGKAKKVVSDKQAKKIEEKSTVLENLKKDALKQPIRYNHQFGNLVHAETSLVFRREDKKVIGHQEDDGTVRALNKEDIQNCKKFKFEYDQLPVNLDDEKRDEEEIIEDEEEEVEEGSEEEVEEEVEEEENEE